jgi:hypothetical protein
MRVEGLGTRLCTFPVSNLGLMVQGADFMVQGAGLNGSEKCGLGVCGTGSRMIQSSNFRVKNEELKSRK